MLVVEPPGANRPTPRVLIEAAKGADYLVTIGAGPGPHTKDHYILLFDHGVSVGLVSPDPHFYTTDDEILHAIDTTREILDSGAYRAHVQAGKTGF